MFTNEIKDGHEAPLSLVFYMCSVHLEYVYIPVNYI